MMARRPTHGGVGALLGAAVLLAAVAIGRAEDLVPQTADCLVFQGSTYGETRLRGAARRPPSLPKGNSAARPNTHAPRGGCTPGRQCPDPTKPSERAKSCSSLRHLRPAGFAAHMNNIVEGYVMTRDPSNYYVNGEGGAATGLTAGGMAHDPAQPHFNRRLPDVTCHVMCGLGGGLVGPPHGSWGQSNESWAPTQAGPAPGHCRRGRWCVRVADGLCSCRRLPGLPPPPPALHSLDGAVAYPCTGCLPCSRASGLRLSRSPRPMASVASHPYPAPTPCRRAVPPPYPPAALPSLPPHPQTLTLCIAATRSTLGRPSSRRRTPRSGRTASRSP